PDTYGQRAGNDGVATRELDAVDERSLIECFLFRRGLDSEGRAHSAQTAPERVCALVTRGRHPGTARGEPTKHVGVGMLEVGRVDILAPLVRGGHDLVAAHGLELSIGTGEADARLLRELCGGAACAFPPEQLEQASPRTGCHEKLKHVRIISIK